jgi:hypothetical protein
VIDVLSNLAISTDRLADEPTTWGQGSSMSLLTALLVFVGGPLLVIALVTLLVMAPSLARGPRYRPGVDDNADPEWFGTLPAGEGSEHAQIGAGPAGSGAPERQHATDATGDRTSADDTGGASARW